MPEPTASTVTLPEFEVIRAGTHTATDGRQLTITEADLAAMASGYDPQAGEVPLVVGHPKLDAPSYGWVKSLRVQDGALFAATDQVNPEFRAMVEAGSFKKRSASVFFGDTAGNPKPGQMYLRHIGFLGAAAPAIPGLRDIQFAGPDAPTFETTEPTMPDKTEPADFAAQQTALDQRKADLDKREAAVKATETANRRKGIADFAAGLVAQGRLLPVDQAPVIELLDTIESQAAAAPLNFAAADGSTTSKPAGAVLRDLLSRMPVQTDLTERAPGTGEAAAQAAQAAAANFAAPQDAQIDTSRLQLDAKARAFQRTNPNTSYLDAVRAVGG